MSEAGGHPLGTRAGRLRRTGTRGGHPSRAVREGWTTGAARAWRRRHRQVQPARGVCGACACEGHSRRQDRLPDRRTDRAGTPDRAVGRLGRAVVQCRGCWRSGCRPSARRSRSCWTLTKCFVLLDTWIRQVFVPSLPVNARLAIGSRNPPSPAWRTTPGWQGLFRSLPLDPLPETDALRYLACRASRRMSHDESTASRVAIRSP